MYIYIYFHGYASLFSCVYGSCFLVIMTVSTENATPLKSTKLRHSNWFIQIQIAPESQFDFVPRDSEKSEILDLVDVGGIAFSVQTAIALRHTLALFDAELHIPRRTDVELRILIRTDAELNTSATVWNWKIPQRCGISLLHLRGIANFSLADLFVYETVSDRTHSHLQHDCVISYNDILI